MNKKMQCPRCGKSVRRLGKLINHYRNEHVKPGAKIPQSDILRSIKADNERRILDVKAAAESSEEVHEEAQA